MLEFIDTINKYWSVIAFGIMLGWALITLYFEIRKHGEEIRKINKYIEEDIQARQKESLIIREMSNDIKWIKETISKGS